MIALLESSTNPEGETVSSDPNRSQQEGQEKEKDLVEDLDVDEDVAKDVTGGMRRAGVPCDGGELT